MSASDARLVVELQRRLSEAEAIIQALVGGQIDAVADSHGSSPVLLENAQRALRESEERHRRIVEMTNEGVWAIGVDNKTTFMNRRMAQMLDCEATMGVGITPFDFLDAEGRVAMALCIAARKAQHLEVHFIRKDGTSLWVLLGMSPLFDSSGGYDGMMSMAMDITIRKQALEAFDELSRRAQLREHMLTTMLSSISDFAYIFDSQGRFLFANQPLLDLWGIELEAAVGRTFMDLGYPEVIARKMHQQILGVFETKKAFTGEKTYAKPLGALGCYEYIFSPALGVNGAVEFVAGCTRDITERKAADAELRLAKKGADDASRAKSEFLATMSHEMRTPLNALLGMIDTLAEGSLTPKQHEYIRICQNAGSGLLDLITDVLDVSRVESGEIQIESIDFDLAAVLEEIVGLMSPRTHARGLQLIIEIHPDVPKVMVGDSNRLRQILTNLVGNALKFTERGSVTIRVEPGAEADWLRFSVIDTGIGIAAEQRKLIFGRFVQADSSTTRKYGGSGLGLAISRGLIERMGGRIGCISELGIGSTFFIDVCFGTCHQTAPKPIESEAGVFLPIDPPLQQPRHRILIAEDYEFNILLLKVYLEDSGFDLDIALNGRSAVDKVLSGRPDLVLMDIQMPVMDGLDATREIRRWEASLNAHPIPILALTAHAANEGIAESLDAGCTEHLTKPIKKDTLLEAIARNLGGKVRITPPKGIEFLIPDYLADTRRQMSEILRCLDTEDCDTARRLGHQFKGSGTGYGFPRIASAGAAVELAAIASDREEVRRQVVALTKYLDRVEIAA